MNWEDSLCKIWNESRKKNNYALMSQSSDREIISNCIDRFMAETLSDIEDYKLGIKTFFHGIHYLLNVFKDADFDEDLAKQVEEGRFPDGVYSQSLFCVRFTLAGQPFLVNLVAHFSETDDKNTLFTESIRVTAIEEEYDSCVIEYVLGDEKKLLEMMLSAIPGLIKWNYDIASKQLFYGKLKHSYSGAYLLFYVLMALQKVQDRYYRRIALDHIRRKIMDDDILNL